jgi:hypothetical protein
VNVLPRADVVSPVPSSADLRDDFWLHRAICRSEAYVPAAAADHDFLIEIADRSYVLSGHINLRSSTVLGASEMRSAYRISNWERGAENATINHSCDEIYLSRENNAAEAAAERKRELAVEQEFQAARRNAVGLIRINISLAIRNTLDRINTYREEAGLDFNWQTTIKPPPSRYAGCDDEGWPLDPEHRANKDLPPLDRAKRLVEIEEYIAKRDEKKDDTS